MSLVGTRRRSSGDRWETVTGLECQAQKVGPHPVTSIRQADPPRYPKETQDLSEVISEVALEPTSVS